MVFDPEKYSMYHDGEVADANDFETAKDICLFKLQTNVVRCALFEVGPPITCVA